MNITKKISEKTKDLYASPIVMGFIGDSVTQGCFDIYQTHTGGLETEFKSTDAYHHKLKKMIETVFPNVPINIINAGISGDSAPRGAERIDRDIISHNPDICVVCFGLNDSSWGESGIGKYKDALGNIFEKLKKANIETIFMTPNMMCDYTTKEKNNEYLEGIISGICKLQTSGLLDKYMEAALDVCGQYDIKVCDCYKKWKKLNALGADTTRLLSNRANHPIEKMHWLFAISLFEAIFEI